MKLNEIMFQIQKMIMKNLIKFGFRSTFRFLIDFHKDNELRSFVSGKFSCERIMQIDW